jgi:hypothetical protein
VSAAKYPDGVLAEQSRRLRGLLLHMRHRSGGTDMPDLTAAGPEVGRATTTRVAENIS